MAFTTTKSFKLGSPPCEVPFLAARGTVHTIVAEELPIIWTALAPHFGGSDAQAVGTPATTARIVTCNKVLDYRELRGLRKALRQYALNMIPAVSFTHKAGYSTVETLEEIRGALEKLKSVTTNAPDIASLQVCVRQLIADGSLAPTGGGPISRGRLEGNNVLTRRFESS